MITNPTLLVQKNPFAFDHGHDAILMLCDVGRVEPQLPTPPPGEVHRNLRWMKWVSYKKRKPLPLVQWLEQRRTVHGAMTRGSAAETQRLMFMTTVNVGFSVQRDDNRSRKQLDKHQGWPTRIGRFWENFYGPRLVIDLCFGVAIWVSLARFVADEISSVIMVVERRRGGGDTNPLSWSMRL
ncbi:hypothetical protein DEO72_LG4g2080 [Vigna unguiculata]|uniref:Uncharacterized protein n=1 Tax=Vigna unguiculata TaxID=3917 RepID=A0A4D6LSU5_VIGUN|nr:hypothetical protein DEO72_LG4g2080 [Vigna unguiculata]